MLDRYGYSTDYVEKELENLKSDGVIKEWSSTGVSGVYDITTETSTGTDRLTVDTGEAAAFVHGVSAASKSLSVLFKALTADNNTTTLDKTLVSA